MASRVYRIKLSEASNGRSIMAYKGRAIGISRQPLFDGARYLLSRTQAQPTDIIETMRGRVVSMRSEIGRASKLTVVETDRGGIGIRAYRPFNLAMLGKDMSAGTSNERG